MGKRVIILALAVLVGFVGVAYAEVQNVKVSGDLTMKAVSRENLDLQKTDTVSNGATQGNQDEEDNLLSIARIRFDADLTDNVTTTIRLINERNWDSDTRQADDTGSEIDLDLAYVSMKEFLYSPLSLTIGRQELRYGNGLVVGDPDTNTVSGSSEITQSDLSLRKAFDAIKAVLNYDPLVVDLVMAKVSEGTSVGRNDDTNLYGINANYALDKETTLESYLFTKKTGSNAAPTNTGITPVTPTKEDIVYTVGMRAVNTSIKNLILQLEGALQFGKYNPQYDVNALAAAIEENRRAQALQVIASYNLADLILSEYKPAITAAYTYLSGEKSSRTSGTYHGWDAMYEDQIAGHLVNRIMGFSNCTIMSLSGKITPVEDVTFNIDYNNLWLNKNYPNDSGNVTGLNTSILRGIAGDNSYRMTGDKHLGQEIDATVTYDYTEDVQFSLLGGMFMPGDAFYKGDNTNVGNHTTATELIGSMKVTF